jgi:hypothetical protein
VALLSKALGDFSVGIAKMIRERLEAGVPAANDSLRGAP